MNFTFSKSERLCSKILIDKLFESGFKQYNSIFKALWLPLELHENVPIQTLISVSKRRFKRANKRNLLKRRIKEAFRKNKSELYSTVEACGCKIAIVIIYNTNQIVDYNTIEEALLNIFEIMKNRITQTFLKNNPKI